MTNKLSNFVIGLIVFFFVLLMIFLVSGPIAFISPGERGVVVNKGKVTGQVYSEGWYIYNSIVKDVVQFDTRTQINEEEIAAASEDLQDVNMTVVVQYRIDPDRVANIVQNIGKQKDISDKIVDPAIQEVIKASTARFPVSDVIRERAELKGKIEDLLTERLSGYGIILEEVSIKNITFSEEFTKAIEAKQVAEQRKQQAEYEAQAVVVSAEGKAKEQALLKENLTPEILQRIYLEKWDGKLPQVVSDGNLIYQLP